MPTLLGTENRESFRGSREGRKKSPLKKSHLGDSDLFSQVI